MENINANPMGDLSINVDKFCEICKEYSTTILDDSDISHAFWIVYDLLRAEADAIEEKEPYAVNTIRRLRDAAHEVFMMESDITDAFEEVMEH